MGRQVGGSGLFCDIFMTSVTDTSLRQWILATTAMMGIVRATSCSSLERSSPLGSGDLLLMIFATVLRVCVVLKYMVVDTLIYVSAPDPARGRGRWPWRMAVVGALGLQYIRQCTFSFSLHVVQSQSGHNRGRVVERRLLARTQGRNADYK